MNQSPAFQFYPKDFLMDDKVAVMNLEQIGAYMKLLCYCWNNNGLPGDEEELKEMCGNPQNWDKIWKKVGKCFYKNSGKLYNKRLDEEKQKQKHWKEKSKEGGIKSGKIRREKSRGKSKGGLNTTKGGSKKHKPNVNQTPTFQSPSPSSSPSSIPSPAAIASSKEIYPPEYESFWKNYPRKKEKKDAFFTWETLNQKQKEEVIIAAKNYADEMEAENEEIKYIKLPKTFLNKKKERWKDYLEPFEKERKDKRSPRLKKFLEEEDE